MDDTKREFEAAVADLKNVVASPGNDVKLRMYGLFKQANAGDVTGPRPGLMDLVGRAKHDAWAAVKGMSTQEAMRHYIDMVDSLKRV